MHSTRAPREPRCLPIQLRIRAVFRRLLRLVAAAPGQCLIARVFLAMGAVCAGLGASTAGHAAPGSGASAKKIVLIAGPLDTHPKHTHEYERNIFLLKHCLDAAPNLAGFKAEIHLGGWPADPATLEDASTIFITSGGSDRNEADHPLYVGDRVEQLARQMRRGCGLVFHHWSTFHPTRMHDRITEWVGGYFDYETGTGPNKWYSAIQTREWTAVPVPAQHPITRGVGPFRLQEEFYFRMRFRANDPRLQPVLLYQGDASGAESATDPLPRTVGWAVERADGGRGFGFTGGHFYKNWWIPEFRRLVLNAIVWTAHGEVPAGGVRSNLERPAKTLILTGHNHPAHDWRAVTAALVPVLELDPRLEVEVTEQVEDLAGDVLASRDLLVLNYVNWERPGLSASARAKLLGYLERGGGLAVIHFANGAFHFSLPGAEESDWPEYRDLVRRVWDHRANSGHDPFGRFRVDITATPHPITAGLSAFDTADELYFNQAGGERIEPLASALSKVTGRHEPMAWAYTNRNARVFQTVLGHAAESIHGAAGLIRRGAVWAARIEALSFDPPSSAATRAGFRSGSQWSPKAAATNTPASPAPAAARQPPPPPASPAPSAPAVKPQAGVLPAMPGLDGGQGGHWGLQKESDWVDGRWNETDVGRHVSSLVPAPGGMVLKGLSLRLGDPPQATVVYDTATATLRGAWTGAFLQFDPARYGLINSPRLEGTLQFAGSAAPAWGDAAITWRGLHVHGMRRLLRYQVGAVEVLESPWIESAGSGIRFRRSFEIAAGVEPLAMTLFEATQAVIRRDERSGLQFATLHGGQTPGLTLALRSDVGAGFETDAAGRLRLTIPPSQTTRRCSVSIATAAADAGESDARQLSQIEDLAALAQPGARLWGDGLATTGQVSTERNPYVIDTLAIPYDNPFRALFFVSGVDFFANGDAAVCTLHGDVWRVSGIDASLRALRWQRYATGLFQPLGVRVVQDQVCVLGRDRVTRLHDQNQDGEADFYESASSVVRTSAEGHDYVTGLEVDREGRFYYTDPRGLHRISADGRSQETLASGWRNPNGMSLSPDGIVTVAPQEGEWTPASAICQVTPGAYYGYGGPRVTPMRPLGYDPPLCWIPRAVDNSSGSQIWVTSDRWGPLKDQLLHLSFGRSSLLLVLRDLSATVPQGAIVPLKLRFLSGAMRAAFRKQDGQLYVAGTRGWVSNAIKDGSLQRVRYTGAPLRLPCAFEVRTNGIQLRFTDPLDPTEAADSENYTIERWNYRYAASYGSEEYSIAAPDRIGHDPLEVTAARLLDDRRSVWLGTADMVPAMQVQVKYRLATADGQPLRGELYATVHARGPAAASGTEP